MNGPLPLRLAAERWATSLWYGEGASSRIGRLLLAPAAWGFGAAVDLRNRRFDAKDAMARVGGPSAVLPVLSVGNLTVGGTGKTPVASWLADRLRAMGARPAIILRGYGDDEWRVHGLLTPGIPVHVGVDRHRALREARTAGCDCAVLDDGFQHRQVARVSNVVLVSADRWQDSVRLLPAGPYRERLGALRRATAVLVTVKAAGQEAIEAVTRALRPHLGDASLQVVHLRPGVLSPVADSAGEGSRTLDVLSHGRWRVISAIGDPEAFERQLRAGGARVVHHWRFPDHHAFRASEVQALADACHEETGVVCTLKDAVKLAPLWPRAAAPLWYVSQTLEADRDAGVLERECDRVLAARAVRTLPAG